MKLADVEQVAMVVAEGDTSAQLSRPASSLSSSTHSMVLNTSLSTASVTATTTGISSVNAATASSATASCVEPMMLDSISELHYFAYPSANSPTIYSYSYWPQRHRLLVSTKESSVKEIYFDVIFPHTSPSSTNPPASCASPKLYLLPVLRVHTFARISPEALVSSIDVFEANAANTSNKFSVLSVTFVAKKKPEQYFLHVYCDFENWQLEKTLACCHEFELAHMPHRVSNLELLRDDAASAPRAFIFVNCSKRSNVLVAMDVENKTFTRVQHIHEQFVEFKSEHLSDNCTSYDMKYVREEEREDDVAREVDEDKNENENHSSGVNRRLTAIGCQNGSLSVFYIDTTCNVILRRWSYENDSFITQLRFFTNHMCYDWHKLDVKSTRIHLLTLRSLEPTRIFNNVLFGETSSYESHQDLEVPASCDLVTSSLVYDAGFTGMSTIVLSTFGKTLLFFSPAALVTAASSTSDAAVTPIYEYELKRQVAFKHALLGAVHTSLSYNGAPDLAILTLNGVSVWQYEPERVAELAAKRLNESS